MLEVIVGVLLTALCASVGWVFNKAEAIGSRVTVLETKQASLPELINSKFDDMNRRLDRIERAMNGSYRHED